MTLGRTVVVPGMIEEYRAFSGLLLDGMEEFPVSGGGQAIAGDPMTFILVSTGRAEPRLIGLDESVNIYR